MKAKRFKVKIMNFEQAGEEFKKAWKLAEKRLPYEPGYDLIIGIPDVNWIPKIFSSERIRIIQTVRDKKPESIRQLARLLNRAQQNVQKDVQELASFGILELNKTRKKGQKRVSIRPEFKWDGFDIAV